MSLQTDRLLIVQLVNFLNANKDEIPLPRSILIDSTESTGEQIWLQPLAGTTKIITYVTGDFEGQLPFAVYYQQTNPRNVADLDVPLWNMADFFNKHPEIPLEGFTKVKIEMTSNPNPFRRDVGGTFVNQAIYNIIYTKDTDKE